MQTEDHAKQQAAAQLSSIRNMLAALYCDYDRLEELRDEHTELTNAITGALDGSTTNEDRAELEEALAEWNEANAEELASLEEAAGDCPHYDRALENIQNDPLSVQVRSGWHNPGEESEPEEFEILLCTGGPAIRIMGELDEYNQPSRAYMQYQDWGTPWTDYYEEGVGNACLEYAQQFYFGE